MKKVVLIVLVIVFFALVGLGVKRYRDIERSREYVAFVADSANDITLKVDQINEQLNNLDYDESEVDITNLNKKLSELESLKIQVEDERESFKNVAVGKPVKDEFGDYLSKTEELLQSFDQVLQSIEKLKTEEEFQQDLDAYIAKSNQLQESSSELENDLNEYITNYTKFDLKQIINEI